MSLSEILRHRIRHHRRERDSMEQDPPEALVSQEVSTVN